MKNGDVCYRVALHTTGNLVSSFAFESDEAADAWVFNELPKLQRRYGIVTLRYRDELDGLHVGDKCHVSGEGDDVFTIIGMKMYSPDRPGFILDSGCCEEVVKCSRVESDDCVKVVSEKKFRGEGKGVNEPDDMVRVTLDMPVWKWKELKGKL